MAGFADGWWVEVELPGLADQVFAEALVGFSQAEHATLLSLLDRVRANLSENMPEEAPPARTPGTKESMPHG